jgi:hypothetical protein
MTARHPATVVHCFATLACAGVLAAGTMPAADGDGPVDPFYLSLLRAGVQHFDAGDYPNASYEIRLACFGMLDDPAQLAECLGRLGLAQDAAKDETGFGDTFRRVVDLEMRFGAWTSTDIPAEIRGRFENLVQSRIPEATLQLTPGFSELLTGRLRNELANLSTGDRRARLAARIAANPRDLAAHLLAGELELTEGNLAAAAGLAAAAVRVAPNADAALCLRGRVSQAQGQANASSDLEHCPATPRGPARAAPVPATAELAAEAPASGAGTSATTGSRATGSRATASPAAASPTPAPAPATAAPAPTAVPSPATPRVAEGIPADLAAELAALRGRLAGARTAAEAATVLADAAILADRHADSSAAQELALETAYRASRWPEVVRYARRAGGGSRTPPALTFYFAVALYETGARDEAAQVLAGCLASLQRTPYVEGYVTKILGPGARP